MRTRRCPHLHHPIHGNGPPFLADAAIRFKSGGGMRFRCADTGCYEKAESGHRDYGRVIDGLAQP